MARQRDQKHQLRVSSFIRVGLNSSVTGLEQRQRSDGGENGRDSHLGTHLGVFVVGAGGLLDGVYRRRSLWRLHRVGLFPAGRGAGWLAGVRVQGVAAVSDAGGRLQCDATCGCGAAGWDSSLATRPASGDLR